MGQKSCTTNKREPVGRNYTAILQTVIFLRYVHSKCAGFGTHSRLFWLQSFVRLQVSFPTHMSYTGCPRRNVKYFGRVFLMLNYTDITQNTYIQSWTVTEIMAREKCGHLTFPRTLRLQLYRMNVESAMQPPLPVVIWLRAERTLASFTAHELRPTR